jgi:DNA-binding transcriptional ArsR family regulator
MRATITPSVYSRAEIRALARKARHRTIQAGIRGGHLATLSALEEVWARHPQGLPFPSQRCLAEKTRQSVRTVRRHIAALKAAGLLRVYANPPHRGPGGRFRRKTNAYLILRGPARGQTRRSHLEDTPVPSSQKRGSVSPPLYVSPPETAPDRCVERAQVAELLARLREKRR